MHTRNILSMGLRGILIRARQSPRTFLWSVLWKISRLLFQIRSSLFRHPLTICVGGTNLQLVPDGAAAAGVWLGLHLETTEIEYILRCVAPHTIFFDVGSNVGLFTIPVAIRLTQGHVFAFEPTQSTFALLRENVRLNRVEDKVTLRQVALADYNGTGVLKVNNRWKDDLNTLGKPNDWYSDIVSEETVLVTTLDTFVTSAGVGHVDILKVDVEGAELLVLKGALELLKRPDAPMILYESYSWNMVGFDYKPQEVMRFLDGLGYRFFKFDSKNKRLEPCEIGNHETSIVAMKPSHPALLALDPA